jgi:hypothetical protein
MKDRTESILTVENSDITKLFRSGSQKNIKICPSVNLWYIDSKCSWQPEFSCEYGMSSFLDILRGRL